MRLGHALAERGAATALVSALETGHVASRAGSFPPPVAAYTYDLVVDVHRHLADSIEYSATPEPSPSAFPRQLTLRSVRGPEHSRSQNS